MLNLDTFVISDAEDKDDIKDAWKNGKTLDPIDFSINGYPVDANNYPVIGKAHIGSKSLVGGTPQPRASGTSATATLVESIGLEMAGLEVEEEEEVASSAEEDKAEVSAQDVGTTEEDGSPRQMRQPEFPDLQQEMDNVPLPTQESQTASGRGRGRSTQKRKGPVLARESPKSRFSVEADEIQALKLRLEEESSQRQRMAEKCGSVKHDATRKRPGVKHFALRWLSV